MIEKELEVANRLGFHARPAALFAKEAVKYKSSILVRRGALEINGKSMIGLLTLAAEKGSRLQIRADGPDEQEAVSALERLFAAKFNED